MRVPVPFPIRSRAAAYGNVNEDDVVTAIRSATYHDVPLSLLRTYQRTIGSDRLAQFESDPATESRASPIVIERGGKLFIRNGNHRATAALRRGARTLRARVAHIGESKRVRFHDGAGAADLLMIDPRAMAATYAQRDVEDVASMVEDVAIICIDGPLEAKPDCGWWSYFDDYESILCRFENAMNSDDVRCVLLKIDSPGGAAAGLNECIDAMLRCKRETGKAVYCYADEGVYSAAYALSCVADEIYLPRAGGVGSIGVISGLVDVTEMNKRDGIRYEVITSGARKADFNPNVPISQGAIARVQKRVDGLAKIYWQLVKDTRGVAAQKLEADTFYGKDAVRKGLADGVMSLESVMSAITGLDKPSSLKQVSRSQHAESSMSSVLKLTEKVQRAAAALAGVSRADKPARAEAKAKLEGAKTALARELAKVTKNTKTTKVTDVHESEDSKSSESSESSSSSSSESSGGSESESYESEEKEVLAMAREITGKRSTREVLGALAAMRDNASDAPKMKTRLARLEQDRAESKVESLIKAGKDACKITPGNEPKARKIAAKFGVKALEAFIDAAAPAIDTKEIVEGEMIEGVAISDEQKKIWTKLGYKAEEFPKLMQTIQKEKERAAKGLPPKRGE